MAVAAEEEGGGGGVGLPQRNSSANADYAHDRSAAAGAYADFGDLDNIPVPTVARSPRASVESGAGRRPGAGAGATAETSFPGERRVAGSGGDHYTSSAGIGGHPLHPVAAAIAAARSTSVIEQPGYEQELPAQQPTGYLDVSDVPADAAAETKYMHPTFVAAKGGGVGAVEHHQNSVDDKAQRATMMEPPSASPLDEFQLVEGMLGHGVSRRTAEDVTSFEPLTIAGGGGGGASNGVGGRMQQRNATWNSAPQIGGSRLVGDGWKPRRASAVNAQGFTPPTYPALPDYSHSNSGGTRPNDNDFC